MDPRLCVKRAVVTLAAAAALAPAAARADRALLVGVNQYPNLKGATLEGCVGDAQSMAQALRAYGFQVTVISDQQATRQGILNALATMKNQVKPNERFVFFFAGHGTDQTEGDKAALLPTDALHDRADNDLKRMDLYKALTAIPAHSRTAVLDSCYSGGMTKAFSRRRSRYYARDIGGGAKSLAPAKTRDVPANDNDPNSNIAGGAAVCYFTAARDNEQAAEDTFGAVRHGVFTYYLSKALAAKSRDANRPTWSEVQTGVTGEVTSYLKDIQHPTLSPAFNDVPLFEARGGGAPAPTPAPKPSTLWDELNGENADPSKVQVSLSVNKTTLQVGDRIRFQVKVGVPGYLVLLEKGTSGKLAIQHPYNNGKPLTADMAAVQAGAVVSIPGPDEEFELGDPGTEYLKAILFPTKETAQAFIAKFPAEGGTRDTLRDLKRVQMPKLKKYTADLVFEVVEKKP